MSMMGSDSHVVAKHFNVDPSTVRRWPDQGCPVILRGKRGPGNATQFYIPDVEVWRGKANGPAGLTSQEILQQIAIALREAIENDCLHVRVDITKTQAVEACLAIWEQCCKSFGHSFRFDERPEAIRALLAQIVG